MTVKKLLPYNMLKMYLRTCQIPFFIIPYKRKEARIFKNQVLNKKQPLNFGEEWKAFVEKLTTFTINCLVPEVKEKVKERILYKISNCPREISYIHTLCHGDYQFNNILAKEVNGEVTEVLVTNYQMLHYGYPILDFINFFFHGTDQKFRRENMTNLCNLYWRTMKPFLEKFDMDIENCYPIGDYPVDFRENTDFGLMVTMLYAPFLFACEAEDVTAEELLSLKFKVDDKCMEHIRGVVDDFIYWSYLH